MQYRGIAGASLHHTGHKGALGCQQMAELKSTGHNDFSFALPLSRPCISTKLSAEPQLVMLQQEAPFKLRRVAGTVREKTAGNFSSP